MDIYLFFVFCLETFCCCSKGLSFFLADLCYIITFHYPFLIAIFFAGGCVTRRSDLHLCYCKARENKILAWSVRFDFFFFFFPAKKGILCFLVCLVRKKDRKGCA